MSFYREKDKSSPEILFRDFYFWFYLYLGRELISMLENKFQANLIREIKKEFPGCMVLKNDSSYLQGVPDLSIFYKHHWAMLEVKKGKNAKRQPN